MSPIARSRSRSPIKNNTSEIENEDNFKNGKEIDSNKQSIPTSSNQTKDDKVEISKPIENASNIPECAICSEQCIEPVKLPCEHVFCYLCVKGIVQQNMNCALCRKNIPKNFLYKPTLVEVPQVNIAYEGAYQWFYKGRHGWWQYDARTSSEIEIAYQNKERRCEILIASYLYVIDFDSLYQFQKNNPCHKRRIKRDLVSAPKKGRAGIKLKEELVIKQEEFEDDDVVIIND